MDEQLLKFEKEKMSIYVPLAALTLIVMFLVGILYRVFDALVL